MERVCLVSTIATIPRYSNNDYPKFDRKNEIWRPAFWSSVLAQLPPQHQPPASSATCGVLLSRLLSKTRLRIAFANLLQPQGYYYPDMIRNAIRLNFDHFWIFFWLVPDFRIIDNCFALNSKPQPDRPTPLAKTFRTLPWRSLSKLPSFVQVAALVLRALRGSRPLMMRNGQWRQ